MSLIDFELETVSHPVSVLSKAIISTADGAQFEVPALVLAVVSTTFKDNSMHRSNWPRPSADASLPVREYTPNVIEPSFGIGRILYSLLEHSYWAREEDVNRGVLSLPPLVAPIKVLIVPLSGHSDFKPLVREVCKSHHLLSCTRCETDL